MNLSEALDAALPELPKSRLSSRFAPRLDPGLVVREDLLDGMPSISVMQRTTNSFSRLTPAQWQLMQLFDGQRTYEEVAELASETTGLDYSAGEMREFADGVESCDFWYKTPQERNLAMSEKLATHRCRRSRSGVSLAHISFSAWDPDRYLSALDRRIGRLVFNRWSTLLALLLFLFEGSVFLAKWKTFGPDVHQYYMFADKTAGDLLEFWLLFFFLGFLHETAHGLTAKHFGAQVHSMGFLLLYLTPAFYCDITEVWVTAERGQRLAAIIAGIWTELVVCGVATIVWTNTQPGQWQHDFSYKLMLITGVAVVVLNVNPLLKLDGYYFLTEWIRVPDLKERSTGFLSAWVQRTIFRMPAQLPMVSANRVPLMVGYAALSGLYSYFMLYSVIRLAYNISAHWTPEFAFVPACGLAFLMFRSRLRTLRGFVLQWTRTHVHALRTRLLPLNLVILALVLTVLFVPLWRERETVYFVMEPAQTAVLHAAMNGRISAVYVHEGETVAAGTLLALTESVEQAATSERAHAVTVIAQQQLYEAQQSRQGLEEATAAVNGATHDMALAREQLGRAELRAPFAGTIVSADPASLVNQITGEGQPVLKLADIAHLRVRLYLPGPRMAHIHAGDVAVLHLPSHFEGIRTTLGAVDGPPVELPPGILEEEHYQGNKLGSFYSSLVPLNPEVRSQFPDVLAGDSGTATVLGARRSLASRFARLAENLLRTHFW